MDLLLISSYNDVFLVSELPIAVYSIAGLLMS